MDNSPLALLLVRAGITSTPFWVKTWFDGVRLDRNILICPDKATAESIDRMFLPDLRRVMADVQIRVEGGGKVQTAWQGQPQKAKAVLSKGEFKQDDLL